MSEVERLEESELFGFEMLETGEEGREEVCCGGGDGWDVDWYCCVSSITVVVIVVHGVHDVYSFVRIVLCCCHHCCCEVHDVDVDVKLCRVVSLEERLCDD